MIMRCYYQYINTEPSPIFIHAMVGSTEIPEAQSQFVTDNALEPGTKKFDPVTREVIFYKPVYNGNDEVIGIEEDSTKSRLIIAEEDILLR